MFGKLLSDVDNEYMEDMFDLLLVAELADKKVKKVKRVFIDQVDL